LFGYRLSNDEPVEWVTMMKRQRRICDNLVTILAGNRPISMYIGAPAGGCDSLKMLVDVAKCELALNGPTGLRTKWWKTEIDVSRCNSSLRPDLQVR
jgi:hypothetical protein